MGDLILAAKRGHYVKVLSELRAGVPVDYQDEEQATALYWACCSGHHDLCQLLLDHRANPNLPVRWGSAALHAAADRGYMNCIRLLLRYGAFVNAVNTSGDTALHLAAFRGHREVCKVLVGHEADLSIINKKGKTPHQEAVAGEHMEIAELLIDKKQDKGPCSYPQGKQNGDKVYYSDPMEGMDAQANLWDLAQRSKSFPLDQKPGKSQKFDRQSSTDELQKPKNDSMKRPSLRREVLQQGAPSARPNYRNVPYMNQLSREDYEFNTPSRPHSDPTAASHRDRHYGPNMHKVSGSGPAKLGNLDVTQPEFNHRQQEAERQHNKTVEDLQVRIATLMSEKEELEKKMKEHEKKYSLLKQGKLMGYLDEEGRQRLEYRVKELMSEVQQERRDRNKADSQSTKLSLEIEQERRQKVEADARNRQLTSELFQLKTSLEASSSAEPSLERGTSNSEKTDDMNNEEELLPQRNFAAKFCTAAGRTYLNCSTELTDVLATLLNDQTKGTTMTAVKTNTCQKLETIATDLTKRSEVAVTSEPGKVWVRGRDYKCVDDKAVDNQLRRQEDGLVTEAVFRIECQSKMAAMKIILNHGRAPSLSKLVHYGTEWEILTNLAPHRNITRILHCYRQLTSDLRDLIQPSITPSLGPLPDNVSVVVIPEYCVSLNALSAICSTLNQTMSERCVLKILLELTKAVHYLKNNGIVHRDIEPSKVFIDHHLRVVLGEFGLARKVVNESNQPIPFVERSQIMAGNVLAWSPELMQYSSDGPPKSYQKSLSLVDVYDASDLYAIAATVCQIVNQSPQGDPSGVDSRPESSTQAVQVPGSLSDEVQSLLKGMLQQNPQNRPTLQEIILRVSLLLFGPSPQVIKSQTDCEAWIQSQFLMLLATAPTNKCETSAPEADFEDLAKRAEWMLCHDYVSNVTALQLWELCQDHGAS